MNEMITLNPTRLIIAALIGLALLLVLIIKFKIHAMISILIGAITIGIVAGMPFTEIVKAVNDGISNTLKGIALLVGLGSMFGAILEASGGAQTLAVTMVKKFGDKKAAWALGLTGLVIAMPVFFDAGLIILIPLAFSLAKRTKKSSLFYCNSTSCRTCCRPCIYSSYTGACTCSNHVKCRSWMGNSHRYCMWYLRNDCCRSCMGLNMRQKVYDTCS